MAQMLPQAFGRRHLGAAAEVASCGAAVSGTQRMSGSVVPLVHSG